MKAFTNLAALAAEAEIHPTAIVEDSAVLGADVKIGPYCIVRANVRLGDRVELKSHVIIEGYTTIGENTVVHPFSVLGAPTPDRKYNGEASELVIGARNTIREYVTMHPGTAGDRMKTVIGDDNLILERVHIAHDCVIGNNVTLINGVGISGHVVIEDNVMIGGMTGVTQYVRIGFGAFVGGHCKIEKDVMPNAIIRGDDGYMSGVNTIGMQRRGVDEADVRLVQRAYQRMTKGEGTFADRVELVEQEFGDNPYVMEMVGFIKSRKSGLTLPRA